MVDIQLGMNEGILLRTTDAARYDGKNEIVLDELYLTNQNLICVYEKSNGLFSKSETIVDKIPLTSISVINGVVQVEQVDDDDYGKTLQLIYTNGRRELIEINTSPKKEYPKWKAAIADAVLQCRRSKTEQAAPRSYTATATTGNPTGMKFCPECGTKLDPGARFCKGCGAALSKPTAPPVVPPVVNEVPPTPPKEEVRKAEPPKEEPRKAEPPKKEAPAAETTKKETPQQQKVFTDEPIRERRTVFEGEIHKCPNCGEVLDSFEVNCPTCGHEFRGAKNSLSVREFAAKLEEIERTRPTKGFGLKKMLANQNEVSETDLKKISLIRSYVIPNTKEDMLEFLILASSNINLQRYNDFDSITESEKAVSDAWQAKFEQAYEKAKLSFGNTPEFKKIQAIYDKKTGEVEKSKKKRTYFWIGFAGFFVIFFVVMFGIIFGMAGSESKAIAAENERLEAIVEQVYDALEADNFVLARARAASLVFSGPDNDEAEIAAAKWDTTRNELLAIIDAAESGNPVVHPDSSKPSDDNDNTSKPSDDTSKDDNPDNSGDKEYGVIGGADSSVEVTVQGNDYLDVKEFGWFISGEYLECIITITNKNSEYAIEYPTYRITAYDESGKILGTEEQVLSLIYPKQDFTSYSLCFELSKKPAKIAVSLLKPDDYNITSASMLDYPSHKQMVGKNISVNKDSVTGEIYNPNDYDVDSAMVVIVFRDDTGTIVFGWNEFVDQIPAGGSVPFEADIYTDDGLPSNCEVLAYFW